MSRAEIEAWGNLVLTLVVFAFIGHRMLDGITVVESSVRVLVWTYFAALALWLMGTIVLKSVLQVVRRDEQPDERDASIEAKADRNAHWFLVVIANVLIWQLIAQEAYPASWAPTLDIATTHGIVFMLFALLYLSHAAKQLSAIIYYRL